MRHHRTEGAATPSSSGGSSCQEINASLDGRRSNTLQRLWWRQWLSANTRLAPGGAWRTCPTRCPGGPEQAAGGRVIPAPAVRHPVPVSGGAGFPFRHGDHAGWRPTRGRDATSVAAGLLSARKGNTSAASAAKSRSGCCSGEDDEEASTLEQPNAAQGTSPGTPRTTTTWSPP